MFVQACTETCTIILQPSSPMQAIDSSVSAGKPQTGLTMNNNHLELGLGSFPVKNKQNIS